MAMKIKVQIVVRSDEGQTEVIREVAQLERGGLRPETLGLSLAEARSILAGLEQSLVEQQVAEFIAQERRCPRCGQQRACKGHHPLVFRTPFGKLTLDSPRLYRCRCESEALKSFSPLADRLPERTSPELAYLETKFAALVSYGLSLELPARPFAAQRRPLAQLNPTSAAAPHPLAGLSAHLVRRGSPSAATGHRHGRVV
jgi:hypothetical protein